MQEIIRRLFGSLFSST